MSSDRRTAPRNRLALTSCAACLGAAIIAAPHSSARSNAAATKSVAASIAYLDGSKSNVPVWKNIQVTIKLRDRTLVDAQPLPAKARQSVFAAPKLLATDLNDDGEAEVLVDVFTAGVDCCRRSVVFHRSGDRYDTQVLDWADTGYRMADVTGQSSPEFLATDSRFPRAWDADARGPLRVLALRRGKVRDISRRVPRQLQRDARIHRRAWRTIRRKNEGDARPVIAAYVADLVRLGRIDDAKSALRDAARNKELGMSRAAFARNLDRKFRTWGYSSRRVLSR